MKKYILLLFLGITITLNAQVSLNVPLIEQKYDKWCWAASSKCMLEYYGYSSIRQCDIAEYTRLNSTWHNYGTTNCCDDALQGCNYDNPLGAGTGTVEDILMQFGNIINTPAHNPIVIDAIEFHLNLKRPLIMRWENLSNSSQGHAMVIFGTNGYEVEFMDPDPDNGGYRELSYNDLLNNGVYKWTHTIVPQVSPYIIPDHCNNCKRDLDKDEEGMDCGGPCPPCEHAPDYKSFTTPTDNLPTVARAIKKITAGNAAVRVLSGQNVSFHTLGTIELLSGFEAKAGSNFNAVIKNHILQVTAGCNKFCHPIVYTEYHRWCAWPWPTTNGTFCVDMTLANKIELEIWAPTRITNSWKKIYTTTVENQVGLVPLWDLVEGDFEYNLKLDNKWRYYHYFLDLYPCQGGKIKYQGQFRIINGKDPHDDELLAKNIKMFEDEESEETKTPDPFLSSISNNINLQDENATPTFSIIPNPNTGTFQLEINFPLSDITHLKIANLLGVTVYETQRLSSSTIQLPSSAFGHYSVIIILKDGSVLTQKMIIQR